MKTRSCAFVAALAVAGMLAASTLANAASANPCSNRHAVMPAMNHAALTTTAVATQATAVKAEVSQKQTIAANAPPTTPVECAAAININTSGNNVGAIANKANNIRCARDKPLNNNRQMAANATARGLDNNPAPAKVTEANPLRI